MSEAYVNYVKLKFKKLLSNNFCITCKCKRKLNFLASGRKAICALCALDC